MSPDALAKDDRVGLADFDGWVGRVVRVARDGSWVDVDWGPWRKRHHRPDVLILLSRATEVTP